MEKILLSNRDLFYRTVLHKLPLLIFIDRFLFVEYLSTSKTGFFRIDFCINKTIVLIYLLLMIQIKRRHLHITTELHTLNFTLK